MEIAHVLHVTVGEDGLIIFNKPNHTCIYLKFMIIPGFEQVHIHV